jgi:hypothetical protein
LATAVPDGVYLTSGSPPRFPNKITLFTLAICIPFKKNKRLIFYGLYSIYFLKTIHTGSTEIKPFMEHKSY